MDNISCELENGHTFQNEWYMNKLSKQRVIKVLNQENGRPLLKMKKVKDCFLGRQELLGQANQYFVEHESSLALDEVVEIESMTLKEMQCLFRKSCRNASRCHKISQPFPLENKVLPSGTVNEENKPSVKLMATIILALPSMQGQYKSQSPKSLSVDCHVGKSTSEHSLGEVKDNVDGSAKAKETEISLEKRQTASCAEYLDVAAFSQVDETEDDWTLGMWKSFNKQHSNLLRASECISPSRKLLDKAERKDALQPSSLVADMEMNNPPKTGSNLELEKTIQFSDPFVNQEIFEESNSDESSPNSPESLQALDEAYSVVVDKNPHVRLVLEDESEPGMCTSLPGEEADLTETAIHTCKFDSKLEKCINTSNIESAESTHSLCKRTDFELTIDQNMSQKSATDCKLQRGCLSLQDGSCTTLSFQSGMNLSDFDRGRGEPRTVNILRDRSKNGKMIATGTGSFGDCRNPKNLGVRKPASARELLPSSPSGIDHRTSHATEFIHKADNCMSITSEQSLSTPCDSNPLLPNDNEVSLYKIQHLTKDEETCKTAEPTKLSKPDVFGLPVCLLSTEALDVEEEQDSGHHKPAKIPRKRKAMSPLSRQKLLWAVNSSESSELPIHDSEAFTAFKGLKETAYFNKNTNSQDARKQECVGTSKRRIMSGLSTLPDQLKDAAYKGGALIGSPPHNKEPPLWQKSTSQHLHFRGSHFSSLSRLEALAAPCRQISQSARQKLSLVIDKSPSPLQQTSKASLTSLSESGCVEASPSLPTKGILRSSSQGCQGICKCEECKSLRFRVEKASEFSQRQMHDIEGLATKLMKELSTMRTIVEENILSDSNSNIPNSRSLLEQIKTTTVNAIETEEMTKKWLLIMARDCNRYCKIMHMQQRKLTFADEAGGQLCQVKLFHSENNPKSQAMVSNGTKISENMHSCSVTHAPSEDSCSQKSASIPT